MSDYVKMPVKISNGPMKGDELDFQVSIVDQADISIDTVAGTATTASVIAFIAALANPTGWLILGAVGIVGGLGFLIGRIIKAVRNANLTTIIIVNAVPNSTLRVKKIERTHGEWVGGDTDDSIEGSPVITNGNRAGALVLNSEPRNTKSQGLADLEVEFQDGFKTGFHLTWYNPLGPDQSRSRYISSIDGKFIQFTSRLQRQAIEMTKRVLGDKFNPVENSMMKELSDSMPIMTNFTL